MNSRKKEWIVVFDCDGVMFDSRQTNINYYNHVRHHFNLPSLAEDEISFVHMNTADESIKYIFKETELTDQALKYREKMDYRSFIPDMIIEPDLKQLLKTLKPKVSLAVATNRGNTIGDVLKKHDLSQYFDIVVSSLDVNHPKPHPESIFKILKFFKVDQRQCLYIGDSLIDYQTARASDVIFVSYQNPELKADFHIRRLRETVDVLRSLGVDW